MNYRDNALQKLDRDLMVASELAEKLRGFFHPDEYSPKLSKEEARKVWYKLYCLIDDTIINKHMTFIDLLKDYGDGT